jgi:hypothetical protein
MFYLPIRNLPVVQNKVWWLLCLLSSSPPQPFTFALVLLINHYLILYLIYFYSTPSILLCSNISISPDQRTKRKNSKRQRSEYVESKDDCIDVNYNTSHVWFDGINGQHIQKPADIRKWEESKCHKLIEKHFPRVKVDKMLLDLSSIALEWAKTYVRQRQTFKLNTKGENMAPLAFQHDPDGTYHELAVQLRNFAWPRTTSEDEPLFEPVEEDEGESKKDSAGKTPDAPVRAKRTPAMLRASARNASRFKTTSPEREREADFTEQKDVISAWIDDLDHPANETCRYSLELYAQLNDSEFAYVSELQGIYDETRCFFLQWVLGKEIKELVNSARISAVQSGKPFT